MHQKSIRSVAIVDENKKLGGVLSASDLRVCKLMHQLGKTNVLRTVATGISIYSIRAIILACCRIFEASVSSTGFGDDTTGCSYT